MTVPWWLCTCGGCIWFVSTLTQSRGQSWQSSFYLPHWEGRVMEGEETVGQQHLSVVCVSQDDDHVRKWEKKCSVQWCSQCELFTECKRCNVRTRCFLWSQKGKLFILTWWMQWCFWVETRVLVWDPGGKVRGAWEWECIMSVNVHTKIWELRRVCVCRFWSHRWCRDSTNTARTLTDRQPAAFTIIKSRENACVLLLTCYCWHPKTYNPHFATWILMHLVHIYSLVGPLSSNFLTLHLYCLLILREWVYLA